MSSDPRRAFLVALLIAASCLPWFAALAVADDALAERFGMNRHAITFLAGTVALFALVAALVFARLAAVRDELLAGRRVIGRWSVDAATWAAFAPSALADDAADRRTALVVVLFFVVVCFGGFALADPEAAPAMASVGGIVAVAMIAAFAFGRRTQASQWRRRTGEVIVGERGLLRDGVLHVWAVPLSRLIGARMQERPLGLVVTYGWWSRAGWQAVSVALPVPRDGLATARATATRLDEIAGGSRHRRPARP
ncbi:MAG: hypothetical protein GX458_03355 [Phyllobacteriaceae bacterium]|nr:hypothetical protein [Phyllobacteriaceae bacterium]